MIHVGTSGWHYKHWKGPFYAPKLPTSKMLDVYCEHFDTVELNNTFYRLPPHQAVRLWKSSTPANFLFAVKGSRFLTHMKKLRDPEPGLERYFERVDLLESKLGPVLFQLPPNWLVDIDRFSAFLAALPARHTYAFEFRNPSWNTKEILQLLQRYQAGYCIYDLGGVQSPLEITANFTYIRLHGPEGKYQGSYSDSALKSWARKIVDWRLQHAYIYFDNDQAGYAPANALRLKQLLSERL